MLAAQLLQLRSMLALSRQHSPQYCCLPAHRWEWWNLWLEAGLLLALFITCFLEQAFKRGRMCFLAFFVLATQGLMWSAHNFLTALELTASGLNTRDLGQDAINAGEQCCSWCMLLRGNACGSCHATVLRQLSWALHSCPAAACLSMRSLLSSHSPALAYRTTTSALETAQQLCTA